MQNFINYLQSKNHTPKTQKAYLYSVNLFILWYVNETINTTKKDILKYLEYLQNNKNQQNITRKNALIALNHYFTYLYTNQLITQNPCLLINIRGTKKRSLYVIYTTEELNNLYDNYYNVFIKDYDNKRIPKNQQQQNYLSRQRNYIMLGLLIYQGLSTSELQNIKLTDVDLNKANIKITGSKKSNARTLPLNATQIGALINYINNIRELFFKYCEATNNLFCCLPESSKQKTSNENLMHAFKPLTKQVKSIDKKLQNFKHIRASVITHWLKIEGLRKAQYNAGHRYISSTENYLPNNLDGLIDDITKFNPF